MNNYIIAKCAEKYFKLTGQSPKYSFWSFLDVCGIEPTEEALNLFYKEMEDYIE